MNAGVILAAGKGSRFNAQNKNKVTVDFNGSSPIQRGVQTLSAVVENVFIVIGHEAESVQNQLKECDVTYVEQKVQKGTGHAFNVALEYIPADTYSHVIVGNGDHMMFYTPEVLMDVLESHITTKSVATCITSSHKDVNRFGFGRIIRTKGGSFEKIVEQKDATSEEIKVEEFNSGLCIFEVAFAHDHIAYLTHNNNANELYITDLFEIASKANLPVNAYHVDFKYVGIGINSREDYEMALKL